MRLIQYHKCLVERAAAHVSQRRNLDNTCFQKLAQLLGRYHVAQGVVQRLQVRIEFIFEVAGQKAEVLASLHCRSGEDDTAHLAVFK